MAYSEAASATVVSLSDLTATSRQRRLVWGIAALQLLAFAIVVPFAATPWRRYDAFIPAMEGIIFVNDLITAILLFAQYALRPSYAILILASGYLFTALIVIPHALTYPFAFAPTGLLGAGLQSTTWLYNFWHLGAPAAILAYACLKNLNHSGTVKQASTTAKIWYCVVIVVSLVCALTLLATVGERLLPVIFIDRAQAIPFRLKMLNAPVVLLCVLAFLTLWVRRRSVLDYWLLLVVCALFSEAIVTAFLTGERFSVGFYVGRLFSLGTSVFVLVLLLTEITKLYRRLARTTVALERERHNKLMNLHAAVQSITHELKQPLGAIVARGEAGMLHLEKAPPDIDRVRVSLKEIVDAGYRADAVLAGVRALFRDVDKDCQPTDLNEVVHEVLHSFEDELQKLGIASVQDLAIGLASHQRE